MSFRKSDNHRIVVRHTEYRGVELVDIRTQIKAKDGGWIFTKQGIQVPVDDYDEFLDYLAKTGVPEPEEPQAEPERPAKKSGADSEKRSSKPAKERSRERKEPEKRGERAPRSREPAKTERSKEPGSRERVKEPEKAKRGDERAPRSRDVEPDDDAVKTVNRKTATHRKIDPKDFL